MISCAVCGHKGSLMTTECGYVTATNSDGDRVFLCHAEDHDCYRRWTVIEEQPVATRRPIVDIELPESMSFHPEFDDEPEEAPVLEPIVDRVIKANLPEELPVGSVVLTGQGVAYQRTDEEREGTALWMATKAWTNARSWVSLLSSGPLYLLTDVASFEWVKQQREEDGDG